MSLNISELLNPSTPSPAPPPLPPSEDTTSSSANTNTQASTIQTSLDSHEPQSQPLDELTTTAMDDGPKLETYDAAFRDPVAPALPGQGEKKPSARRNKGPSVPKRIATPKARTPHGAPLAALPVEPCPPLEHT